MTFDKFLFKPLSKSNWEKFENLFGQNGACGGCWCMHWRLQKSVFDKNKGSGNKKLMFKLVNSKAQTGILTFYKKEAVGWCAVAPREHFIRLDNSKILSRVDEQPVWSIVCFFVHKKFRKVGLSSIMLKAVIDFAKSKKIKILEGYPVDQYLPNMPPAFAWTGFTSAFLKAGFIEVKRRSKSRPIMRYYL